MDNLQELFVLPFGAEVVATFGNIPVYSSEKLKEKFIEAILLSKTLSKCIDKIAEMVKYGQIVPCWQSSNVISFIARSIFAPARSKILVGAYSQPEKTIYIVIDNKTNWFLSYPNELLEDVLLHELCHKFAVEIPGAFYAEFNDVLQKFYSSYFMDLFSLPKEKSKEVSIIVEDFLKFLVTYQSKAILIKKFIRLYEKELDSFGKLAVDKKQFRVRQVSLLITIAKIASEQDPLEIFSSSAQTILPLYEAYKRFGLSNLDTICLQELVAPSEVVSILCGNGLFSSKFLSLMKKI